MRLALREACPSSWDIGETGAGAQLGRKDLHIGPFDQSSAGCFLVSVVKQLRTCDGAVAG